MPTVSGSNNGQLVMAALEGALLGAASAAIGIKLYQFAKPQEKINPGKFIAMGAIFGGLVGVVASLSLDPEKLARIQKIALEILIVEAIVLIAAGQVEDNKLVERCITKFNGGECASALKLTIANTAKKAVTVVTTCSTGFNPLCAAAVVDATIK